MKNKIHKYKKLTVNDVCESFGIPLNEFPDICKKYLEEHDFFYRYLDSGERDGSLLNILRNIENAETIDSPERTQVWENGWLENLNLFKTNKNISSLEPKYIKNGQPVRFKQNLIVGRSPDFQKNFMKLFQLWFFHKYANYPNIYEFGCGTGFNIIVMAKLFPSANLFGFDFVESSINLIDEIAKHYNIRVKSRLFNMKIPDYSVEILPNSCVFTCGTIEQLSEDYHNFIRFLINKKPSLCVHQEPMTELFEENNLMDYLAKQYQTKRGYPKSFLKHMRELEKNGVIKIFEVRRIFFGSEMSETYNYIVWRPIR